MKNTIQKFPFTAREHSLLKRLNSPINIQDYLDTVPINFEKNGETYMSPRRSLGAKKMHCLEGALFAALALWYHGEEPLLMDLKARGDDDHIVALYKRNGYWGAISKTNHATVRFRDPIYKTTRELALSYFHEYFLNSTGKKCLVSYSKPFSLKSFSADWITTHKNLHHIAIAIDDAPHYALVPAVNRQFIRKADRMERRAGKLTEWTRSDPRT